MDDPSETMHRVQLLEHSNRAMELELLLRSIEDLLSELDDRSLLSTSNVPRTRGRLDLSNDGTYEAIISILDGLERPSHTLFGRESPPPARGASGSSASETDTQTSLQALREQNNTPSMELTESFEDANLDDANDSEGSLIQASLRDFQLHWEGMLNGSAPRQSSQTDAAGAVSAEPTIFEEPVAAKPVATLSKAALRQELERERDRMLCTVCLLRHKRMLLVPCRHACMCRTCAGTILTVDGPSRQRCPVCRTPILGMMEIFIS